MPPMPFRPDMDPDDYPGDALTREPSCRLVLELLPESLAGDLDPTTTGVVDAHLGACVACAREARGLRAAREALMALRAEDGLVDESFFDDLHRDILGEVEHRTRSGVEHEVLARGVDTVRGRGVLLRFVQPLLQVASIAAALLVGLWIGRQQAGPAPESNRTVAGGEVPGDGVQPVSSSDATDVRRLPRYDFDREQRLRVEELLRSLTMPRIVVPDDEPETDAGLEAPETRGRDF